MISILSIEIGLQIPDESGFEFQLIYNGPHKLKRRMEWVLACVLREPNRELLYLRLVVAFLM